MDVLTSEACWALNNEIKKQVTSSWSFFTTHEIIQQISRKLLRMDVLIFETCWALNIEIKKQVTSSWSLFIQLLCAEFWSPCAQNRLYRAAVKPLARPGNKQTNVSVRMARISFGALPCRKKMWWQLASRFCWNRARRWHASELVSSLVELSSYEHPGQSNHILKRELLTVWSHKTS